jgi:hypothetical protein
MQFNWIWFCCSDKFEHNLMAWSCPLTKWHCWKPGEKIVILDNPFNVIQDRKENKVCRGMGNCDPSLTADTSVTKEVNQKKKTITSLFNQSFSFQSLHFWRLLDQVITYFYIQVLRRMDICVKCDWIKGMIRQC